MSDTSYMKLFHTYLNDAESSNEQRDDQATRYYLAQAAAAASEIVDDTSRRHALSSIAKHAVNMEYPELSQQLARQLIRLDRQLGRIGWVITDLLSYGSSLHHSRQHLEAEGVYLQAYDLALEIKSWQRAAAASTNYAAAIAARGALDEAQKWLESSLKYLHREPDLDTEVRTRVMLIQTMHIRGEKLATCFETTRELLNEHKNNISRVHRILIHGMMDPVLKSYFNENPDLEPQTWIRENFPELMEATDE